MPFKRKNNKKIKVDEKSITTLDKKHDEMMEHFKYQEEVQLPKLEKERMKYKRQLEGIQKHKEKTLEQIENELEVRDKLKELEQSIKKIKQYKKEYYLENSKYMFNYFENKKNITKQNTSKKNKIENFFNPQNQIKNTTLPKDEEERLKESNYCSKQYLMNIDDSFIDIGDYTEVHDKCENCQGELVCVDHEGVIICKQCYRQSKFLIEPDKPSYKEPPKEASFYAYKRINHFREILAQFQAKETTHISKEIIQNIKNQIKKERISLNELTNEKTKHILKNLGYNKYYEHIPFIKNKLGIKPPIMSIELENRLCNLFLDIQKPYAKFCPNERVNFLNYYYVLYKLCELLEEDHYLKHLYMLKDPVKRMEQDQIWKKICGELNWEFIPTL